MMDYNCLATDIHVKDFIANYKYKKQFALDHPEYFNPDGCVVFCGAQGSGKTLSAVRYINNLCKLYPAVKVVSNCSLSLPNYHNDLIPYEGIEKLKSLDNGYAGLICFIDEIQSEFSSLESAKIHPSALQIISMQRKRRLHVVGTSQLFKRIAKPWREQINAVIDCSMILNILCKNSVVDFSTIAEDADGNLTDYKHRGNFYFFKSPALFGMYDTFEKVKRVGGFSK